MLGFSWIKLAIIGLVIALIVGYVTFLKIEVSHYKAKEEATALAFKTYQIQEEGMQAALKSSNSALTLESKQNLIVALKANEDKAKAIKERIASDQAAKNIVVPSTSVQLLNDSASPVSSNHRGPASSITGNASDPSTTEGDYTFQDVESAFADNAANHLACIKVVEAWQQFWKTFSENVGRVAASGASR